MRVAKYRTHRGVYRAVIKVSHKYIHFVMVDSFPLRKQKVKKAAEGRYFDYCDDDLGKVAAQMSAIGRRQGMTKGAEALLKQAEGEGGYTGLSANGREKHHSIGGATVLI